MANKNKIVNQAQKFIAKAQWDKAIKELQKAISLDPGDVRTLLKLGDVYSKQGDRANATKTYKEVANSYSEQGFFLKAVAVHKQILKHDGNNLEVRLKLAELYEQLGLASEAQSQYQEVARIHDDKGDTQGSLDVLKRLVDLDNENVASRIKLAEGYSRAGQVEEAVQAFAKAAEVLKRQNRVDDYIKVAERLVYHDPDRIPVIRDLARLYLTRGDTKRGLAKLQLCFKAQPRDVETLVLLAQAFNELGQVQKTIFVYKELAGVYADSGMVEEAHATQHQILALDPNDQEARAALQPRSAPVSAGLASPASHPAPSSAPAPAPHSGLAPGSGPRPRLTSDLAPPGFAPNSSPRVPISAPVFAPRLESRAPVGPRSAPSFTPNLAPRAAPPPRPVDALADIQFEDPVPLDVRPPPPTDNDRDRAIQDIITETDVFVRYGLADKALGHLRRVFDLDPDNVLAYEKMRDIHVARGDSARAAEAVSNIMHTHARTGDMAALEVARRELARLAPGHPLAQGGLPGAIPPPHPPRDEDDLSIDIIEDSGVFGLEDFSEHTNSDTGSGFEVPDDFAAGLEQTDAAPIPSSSPFMDGPSFGAFQPSEESQDLATGWPDADPAQGLTDEDEAAFVFEEEDATMAVPGLSDLESSPEAARPAALPSQDDPFAENVVTELPVLPPARPLGPFEEPSEQGFAFDGFEDESLQDDPSLQDEGLQDGPALSEDEALFDASPDESTAEVSLEAAAPLEAEAYEDDAMDEPVPSLDDELEEVVFYLENDLLDEAHDALALILARAPGHPEAQALLARLQDAEANEADDTDDTDNLEDTDERVLVDSGPSASQAELDAAFADLPEEEVPEEDPENQYDMGMVMMEMMRLDDAIAAFDRASHSPSRRLSALEMIGHCYREKQLPLEAIEYFAQALEKGAEGPAATNLMYEIGAAYEQGSEFGLALQWMEKCAADDASHRDVASRIAALASQVGLLDRTKQGNPEHHTVPRSGKKNKISYL